MAEATSKQPLAIRTTDDLKEKFKNFTEELGVSSGDFFEKLLSSYEIHKKEETMPQFSNDFKDIQTHLNALSIKFHNAYDMIVNAEQTAIQKFERELSVKTEIIQELQLKIKSLRDNLIKNDTESATLKANSQKSLRDKEEAEKKAEQLQADKDDLRKQIDNLNSQINDFKERENNLNALNSDLNLKLKESASLADKVNSLENELRDTKHLIDIKDLELNNDKKSFNDLNALYNKADKENSKLKTEIDTLKETVSSLKSEVAEMKVLKAQLEEEKKRANEFQKTLLATISEKTTNVKHSNNKGVNKKE